jgi:hypothetical protein
MKSTLYDFVVVDEDKIIVLAYGAKMTVAHLPYDTHWHIEFEFNDMERYCNPNIDCDTFNYNYNIPRYYKIMDIYRMYSVVDDKKPDANIENFHEKYPEYIKMKMNDHYGVIDVGGRSVMMIPGILNLSKQDTAELNIYIWSWNSHVVEFDVYKKKVHTFMSIYLLQFNIF